MTLSRRERLITWAWILSDGLLFSAALFLPWGALAMSLQLDPDYDPWKNLWWTLPLNAIYALILIRNWARRARHGWWWERYCAEKVAQKRPDDRDEERALLCSMEMDEVMERHGLKGRRFVVLPCHVKPGSGCIFWLDFDVDLADLKEVRR